MKGPKLSKWSYAHPIRRVDSPLPLMLRIKRVLFSGIETLVETENGGQQHVSVLSFVFSVNSGQLQEIN